jgi:transcriptional regulator with XRE-family HTH domain
MPERSFGRTVRYRRTKLGLSQAKLGELVGRSAATVRSWERDKSRPDDPKVIGALAAILGVNEKQLFGKADVEVPLVDETSPSVEEALATLAPPGASPEVFERTSGVGTVETEADVEVEQEEEVNETPPSEVTVRELVGVVSQPEYAAPPDPHVLRPLTPTLAQVSYMEDRSQRQMYRIRTLATLVASVALVVALIWAFGEGLSAIGEWWDDFFGNLRL